MIEAKDFYDHGLALHGHKCPAMPMGLRVGAAALNALGVERAADGQLLALVDRVMGAPAEQLLSVGQVFSHPVERHPHSFAGLVCAECGEMMVEGYARLVGERQVCIPCREKLSGLREPAR